MKELDEAIKTTDKDIFTFGAIIDTLKIIQTRRQTEMKELTSEQEEYLLEEARERDREEKGRLKRVKVLLARE